ncbi:sulfotransferase family protein [Roseospirillum parvum]|uniref:Sulfotransferase family protein n=1 Tax=Roseospirillum parvum TaxID=83401 RepID=A0A1G7VBH4_9PROT|nr:sulfotransferase [Roseospirillum parvum]SDG56901.1 Sulfotransferase family protein [Roseospirillum parvum]
MFEETRARCPPSADLLSNLAHALDQAGRPADGLPPARQAVVLAPPGTPSQWRARFVEARLLATLGRNEDALAAFEGLADSPLPPAERRALKAELARLNDRLDRPQAAFAAAMDMNRLAAAQAPRQIDPRAFIERVARMAAWATPARLAEPPPTPKNDPTGDDLTGDDLTGDDLPDPILLVGYPGAGTTLLDTLLGAHPGVRTGGGVSPLGDLCQVVCRLIGGAELYPAGLDSLPPTAWAGLRRALWADAEQRLGPLISPQTGAPRRLLDRRPFNIIDLPFAARLFPGAPVLVALRDPRDLLLCNLMRDAPPSDATATAWRLDTCAEACCKVMRPFLAQRDHLNLDLLVYRHEDLIAQPATTLGRVLAHLGLPASPGMADAPAQAPSDPTIGRWRAYRAVLAPALPELTRLAGELGYPAD